MSEEQRPERCPQASDEDLAAYSLGALEATAAERLEQHLDGCEKCRAHLRWLEPAVGVLSASVVRRAPPSGLRRRVLAEVRADAKRGEELAKRARSPTLGDRLRRRGVRVSLAGAGAALAVAIGAIVVVGGDGEQGSVLAEPTPAAPAGMVSARLERLDGSAILRVGRMPRLQPDRVYQVWVSRDGALEPSSLFVLRRDGSAEAAVPGPLDEADAVLVTEEPSGGSTQPTSAPLLQARLG